MKQETIYIITETYKPKNEAYYSIVLSAFKKQEDAMKVMQELRTMCIHGRFDGDESQIVMDGSLYFKIGTQEHYDILEIVSRLCYDDDN